MMYLFNGWLITKTYEEATTIRDNLKLPCMTFDGKLLNLGGAVSGNIAQCSTQRTIIYLLSKIHDIHWNKIKYESEMRDTITKLDD